MKKKAGQTTSIFNNVFLLNKSLNVIQQIKQYYKKKLNI